MQKGNMLSTIPKTLLRTVRTSMDRPQAGMCGAAILGFALLILFDAVILVQGPSNRLFNPTHQISIFAVFFLFFLASINIVFVLNGYLNSRPLLSHVNPKNIVIVFIFISVFFVHLPGKDFGDGASCDIMDMYTQYEYIKQNPKVSITEFNQEIAYKTYGTKLKKYNVYILPPESSVPYTGYNLQSLHIKVLAILARFFSFGIMDMETLTRLWSVLILAAGIVFPYLFGREIKGPLLGLCLAGVFGANYYFLQTVRSGMYLWMPSYVPLFFGSFYFILRLFRRALDSPARTRAAVGLGLCLALCFSNGYPITHVVLIGQAGLFTLVLAAYALTGRRQGIALPGPRPLLITAAVGLAAFLALFGLHDACLGKEFLFSAHLLFTKGRVWSSVFGAGAAPNPPVEHFNHVRHAIHAAFANLFYYIDAGQGVHAPNFLLRAPLLNVLERVLLMFGLVIAALRVFRNDAAAWLTMSGFAYFLLRAVEGATHSEFVARFSFDLYFGALFAVAYGLYAIAVLGRESGPEWLKRMSGRPLRSAVIGLLFVSVAVNCVQLNRLFISTQGENLGGFCGLYDTRHYIMDQTRNARGRNLLVIQESHPLTWTLLTQLRTRTDIMKLEDLVNYPGGRELALQHYEAVYFVAPEDVKREHIIFQEGVWNVLEGWGLPAMFSLYAPVKTVTNLRGEPLYYIYKLTRNQIHTNVPTTDRARDFTITLEPGQRIDYLDIPGQVAEITLDNGQDAVTLDFSDIHFYKFHLDFGPNSRFDIYHDLRTGWELNDIEAAPGMRFENGTQDDIGGGKVGFGIFPNLNGSVDFRYRPPLPVTSVLYNTPYVMFNDGMGRNVFRIKRLLGPDDDPRLEYEYYSNGSGRYTSAFNGSPPLQLFHNPMFKSPPGHLAPPLTVIAWGRFDADNSKDVTLRYEATSFMAPTMFYSKHYFTFNSPFRVQLTVDASELERFARPGKALHVRLAYRDVPIDSATAKNILVGRSSGH